MSYRRDEELAELRVENAQLRQKLNAVKPLVAYETKDVKQIQINSKCSVIIFFDTFTVTRHVDSDNKVSAAVSNTLNLKDNTQLKASIDAFESLLLKHVCNGIAVTAADYVEGLQDAVNKVIEVYDDE